MPWTQALPRLSGELAAIREVALGDAPSLFEMLGDPCVSAHMSAPPPSIRAFQGFIGWAHAERVAGRGCCFGIVPHGLGTAVGIIQLRNVEPSCRVAEWGFAIGPAFWSTGVFLAAAHLVAEFAFDTLGVDRLEARVTATNGRGIGVLQKLGAGVEAVLARSFARSGHFEEQLLWTVTDSGWRERPAARQPFSPAEVKARIAEAVARTQETLLGTKPSRSADAPLYPFFVTQPRKRPS